MKKDYIKTDDLFMIPVAYFPVQNPKGIVQVVHGSWEHKERYFDFISYLNAHGYAGIISDNRGHGEAVTGDYPLGHMESLEESISDLHFVTEYAKKVCPNVPISMLGHSLGSMYARVYLENYDNELANLILSGTINYHPTSAFGPFFTSVTAFFKGGKYKASLFLKKASGLAKPSDQWVSYSKGNLESIKADNLMADNFTIGGYKVLFKVNKELANYKKYKVQNPNLRILSINGIDDPLTGGEKGLKDSVRRLKRIGYSNIECKIYPKMMHEILQEDKKELVYQDVLSFLDNSKAK